MIRRPFIFLLISVLVSPAMAEDTEVIVFQNVRVLTMTDAGVLEGAAVTVEGDTIAAIAAPGNGEVPDGARVVDGTGLTLMPGLADMHVHYWSEVQGPLYLANSVTTLRNMWGSGTTLNLDDAAKRGSFAGPHIYTPGPLMDGPEPIWGEGSAMLTTPDQAIGAVESQRTTGYTAVKLYEGLTPEIYAAAVSAAQERDMQVYTHVPEAMTIEDVLALGVDSIEHFEGVSSAATTADEDARFMTRWANADPDRLWEIAEASAEAGVWHSPTFSVIAVRYEYANDPDAFFEMPEAGYVSRGLAGWWRSAVPRMGRFDEEKQIATENQRTFARMLYDAGAPMLIGTDTPNPFVLPGFAIHDELEAFIAVGIPVDEVLRMATADAARFLREEGEWGVVAAGARADLVLLDADPREDLSTLRRPAGVMMNGHWYDAAFLDEELAEIREAVEAEAAAASDAD